VFPLRDENPTELTPFVTVTLIVINVAGGVAFWAHIDGFVSVIVLIKLFARPTLVTAERQHRRLTREELGLGERW